MSFWTPKRQLHTTPLQWGNVREGLWIILTKIMTAVHVTLQICWHFLFCCWSKDWSQPVHQGLHSPRECVSSPWAVLDCIVKWHPTPVSSDFEMVPPFLVKSKSPSLTSHLVNKGDSRGWPMKWHPSVCDPRLCSWVFEGGLSKTLLADEWDGTCDTLGCHWRPHTSSLKQPRKTSCLHLLLSVVGMWVHLPLSPLNFQPWKGHSMQLPITRPPIARLAPRCGQYASTTCARPSDPRNTAKFKPETHQSAFTKLTNCYRFHSGLFGQRPMVKMPMLDLSAFSVVENYQITTQAYVILCSDTDRSYLFLYNTHHFAKAK